MKRTNLPQQFQELLQGMPYVTIATVCPDGTPWNTPMVGHFDERLNLYWVTDKNSQHSQNIAASPYIFVVVYDTSALLGTGMGLYLQMKAEELRSMRAIDTSRRLCGMKFSEHRPHHPDFLGECPRRMYRATPERIWCNGNSEREGHVVDVRLELTKR